MRLAILLLLAGRLSAQESRFNVQSRMVLVPTAVTDARGRTVDGLGALDFPCPGQRESAERAIVDTIDAGVAPIALVIAVPSSGVSAAAVEKLQRIGSVIQPLITGQRGAAAVVWFDQQINWLQDFTSVGALIDRAFRQIRPLTRPARTKRPACWTPQSRRSNAFEHGPTRGVCFC
jgi:hypothetical protein